MGFIGFFVKLIHIPINNIIVWVYYLSYGIGKCYGIVKYVLVIFFNVTILFANTCWQIYLVSKTHARFRLYFRNIWVELCCKIFVIDWMVEHDQSDINIHQVTTGDIVTKCFRYNLHEVDPLSYFSFQPVLHNWCNKGSGMCYPVCGMVHIKEPLLLIRKSSPCGGSRFPFSLSEWSFTICLTSYNSKENVLSASLNKTFLSLSLLSHYQNGLTPYNRR